MAIGLKKTEICLENYEPPIVTRRRFWRHTKKQNVGCGNINAPGLLDYNDTNWPLICFFVALTFEIWGLILLNKEGMAWFFAIFLGLIDLILAIGQHLPAGRIQELQIFQFIAKDSNTYNLPSAPPHGWLDVIKKKINLLWIPRVIFASLIVGVGLFKVVSYFSFVGELNPEVLLISVTYLIVAIIHIWWTGYFMFWLCTEISEWFQHKKYADGVAQRNIQPKAKIVVPFEITTFRAHTFALPAGGFEWRVIDRHVLIAQDLLPLFLEEVLPVKPAPWPCNADLYSILAQICPMNGPRPVALNQHPNPITYVLLTWGIMTDDQVRNLFFSLLPPNSEGVIIEVIIHQTVNIMGLQRPWDA